jgi:hypothetical protein
VKITTTATSKRNKIKQFEVLFSSHSPFFLNKDKTTFHIIQVKCLGYSKFESSSKSKYANELFKRGLSFPDS